jgi:Peptidase family M50
MRYLRHILRAIFALEALGLLSLAFFVGRLSKKIAALPRLHLGPHSILELLCFIGVMAAFAALAAWRMGRTDPFGRWSLLAVSILNLPLFPLGTMVALAGFFYFVRNPDGDPALDRKHQPIAGDGTTKWSGAVFMIVQIVWGGLVLGSIHRWTIARRMPQVHSEALFWITLACAVYGSISFHELGHFVFGDLVGFRLMGFGVGPVSWVRQGDRWPIQMRYDKLLGGHTAMVPTTPRNIWGRSIILTLGGPLASLALGAMGTICLLLIPGPAWPAAIGQVVALAAAFAFGDFLFNLLPMATQAQYSDGARLWQMYRRGPWCDFHCANYYMGLSQATPLRPREWPTEMVVRAADFAAQLPEPAGSFAMAYLHFLDCGDVTRAVSWLDRAREVARSGRLAHALTVDRAFIEAFHHRRGGEAQRLFDQTPPREDSTDYWRALAAVQAAQGDLVKASATWNKAWELARDRPINGIYDMDREQLRLVGAWLEELRPQLVPA